MSDSRQTILEQLAAGALSVEEAAAQLSALRSAPEAPEVESIKVVEAAVAAEAPEAEGLKAAEAVGAPATAADAVQVAEAVSQEAEPELAQSKATTRRLRIIVTERASQRQRVHISLPLGLIRFGLDLGEKWGAGHGDLDWQGLRAALEQDGGVLMDVDDDNQHVEIRID